MSRIWFVQFADGYFAVDKHYMELQKLFGKLKGELEASKPSAQLSASPPTPASILGVQSLWLIHDLTRWFREMPVLAKIRHGDPRELMSKLDDWQNVALAWNGLRDRSTTKAEDLYGIIAVVVDLSAGEILKLQHEERLKAIFRSQNTLPLPLLYQTGPRLLDNNGQITWAPAGIVGDRLALHSGYVTVSTEGLSIEPRRWVNMNWPQAVLFAPSQIYSRYLDIELNATGTRRTIELGSDPTYLKPQSPERLLCCIYDDTLIRHDISTFAPGVCLTIESQDHAVYSASYMCPIKVFACSAAVPDFAVGHPIRSNTKLVSGSVLDWKKHVIIVKSSECNFTHCDNVTSS